MLMSVFHQIDKVNSNRLGLIGQQEKALRDSDDYIRLEKDIFKCDAALLDLDRRAAAARCQLVNSSAGKGPPSAPSRASRKRSRSVDA